MKLLIGVTASVAASLTPKLVLAIAKNIPNIEIKLIATSKSLYFFQKEDVAFPILTDKDEWPETGYIKGAEVPHIELGNWADVLLIAPLTADTLSDIAHGKSSKFLTSVVLAWPREKQIIVAPAMNTRMWENPITQANLSVIQDTYDAEVIGPKEKMLACGTYGIGAMADIATITAYLLMVSNTIAVLQEFDKNYKWRE